jgi:hypothetical protein
VNAAVRSLISPEAREGRNEQQFKWRNTKYALSIEQPQHSQIGQVLPMAGNFVFVRQEPLFIFLIKLNKMK